MAISNKVRGFMEKGSWIRKMFEEGISLKKQYGEENVFDYKKFYEIINELNTSLKKSIDLLEDGEAFKKLAKN